MRYSPEALIAFVEAASLGSFSAAARKLNKSQSTISTAIANLEADLNLVLFDRHARHPVLTVQGSRVLSHVQDILAASERLDQVAIRLSTQLETRFTLALSDVYQPTHYESLLNQLSERYPDLEFECFIAEYEDVIDLLQRGRAHLGLLKAQASYPTDISAARIPEQTKMGLYVSHTHQLAKEQNITYEHLSTYRELRLNTFVRNDRGASNGLFWSAPNYLMLQEMAEQGFGWAILPRWLVKQFNLRRTLVELAMPGWPKTVSVDAVWSKGNPPGPAGSWFKDRLLEK